MRAKELAKAAGVSKDTLRYYENIGLLSKPMRGENDYRIYSSQHINELKFIKYAKSVGFELSKIKLAIPHIQSPQPNCPLLQQAVKEQLSAIDAKIDELQEAKTTLQKWITPHD